MGENGNGNAVKTIASCIQTLFKEQQEIRSITLAMNEILDRVAFREPEKVDSADKIDVPRKDPQNITEALETLVGLIRVRRMDLEKTERRFSKLF